MSHVDAPVIVSGEEIRLLFDSPLEGGGEADISAWTISAFALLGGTGGPRIGDFVVSRPSATVAELTLNTTGRPTGLYAVRVIATPPGQPAIIARAITVQVDP